MYPSNNPAYIKWKTKFHIAPIVFVLTILERRRLHLHKGVLMRFVFSEDSKDSEDVVDKEESSATARPAKRARTSFTVDQLQVLYHAVETTARTHTRLRLQSELELDKQN